MNSMNDKDLEEARKLNQEAKANMTSDGASKVSMTQSNHNMNSPAVSNTSFTSSTTNSSSTTSSPSSDPSVLEEVRQQNAQSRANKGTSK